MARYNRRKPSRVGGPLVITALVWVLALLVAVVGGRRLAWLVLLGVSALTIWLLVRG